MNSLHPCAVLIVIAFLASVAFAEDRIGAVVDSG